MYAVHDYLRIEEKYGRLDTNMDKPSTVDEGSTYVFPSSLCTFLSCKKVEGSELQARAPRRQTDVLG